MSPRMPRAWRRCCGPRRPVCNPPARTVTTPRAPRSPAALSPWRCTASQAPPRCPLQSCPRSSPISGRIPRSRRRCCGCTVAVRCGATTSCGSIRKRRPPGPMPPRWWPPCCGPPWPASGSPGTRPPRPPWPTPPRSRPCPTPVTPTPRPLTCTGWQPRGCSCPPGSLRTPAGAAGSPSPVRTWPSPCTAPTRSSPPCSPDAGPPTDFPCPRRTLRIVWGHDDDASRSAHAAYLRHPDVHGDTVTFTAANDAWIAPLTGGRAWRLTDEGAPVGYPRFSPDGAHVAYTSRASGGPEIWLVSADGSTAPRRLTTWGRVSTRVAGWLADGRVLVSSSHTAPIARDAQLWAVDLEGRAELLPLGRSSEAAIHPDGTTVVATPWRRDQAGWKHYQGGTAVKLWISRQPVALDAPAAEHAARPWERLLEEVLASKTRIAWYGDRLIFASDTPGPGAALTDRASANLWSIARDGSDLRAHTSLRSEYGYLREPATDGSTIVFCSRGRLFAMDSLDSEPREVEILASGVGSARLPRPATPDKTLLAMRPVHDARASLVEWRGGAHLLTHRGGPSRVLASQCGLRFREVRPLGRSPFAVMVTDAAAQSDRETGGVGSDELALRRLDGGGQEIRLNVGDVGRILHAIPSPDGSKIAISSFDNVVRLVTLRGLTDPASTSADTTGAGTADGGADRKSTRLNSSHVA